MKWDTAAGQAIVEASGGSVLAAEEGLLLRYNKGSPVNLWLAARKATCC